MDLKIILSSIPEDDLQKMFRRLVFLRKISNITIQKIADAYKTNVGNICKLEKKQKPTITSIVRYLEAFLNVSEFKIDDIINK